MYKDLIYQIETMIGDADDDPHGLMKMRKLVDILNSASRAVSSKRVQLLKVKAKQNIVATRWGEEVEKHMTEMREDLRQLKLLLHLPEASEM